MRNTIAQAYTSDMARFLSISRGISLKEAEDFVVGVAKRRFKDKKVSALKTQKNGDVEVVDGRLSTLLNNSRDNVLTPNGCVYNKSDKVESITSQFVKSGLAQRKAHKKAMLKAKAVGDSVTEQIHHFAQATIKILLNALPGGMGSPFNPFYDKGGYNSITSLARSLIATSYTVAEQSLGGNFAWFTEEELINHIIINLPHCPEPKDLRDLCFKYGLNLMGPSDLDEYLTKCLTKYISPMYRIDKLHQLISNLTVEQCTYIYYLSNLRHLIMDYPAENIKRIKSAFDFSNVITDGINPEDLYKLDEDLMAVLTPQFVDILGDMQVYDLPKKDHEKAKLYIACHRHLQNSLAWYNDMFQTFVYSKTNIPKVTDKKNMLRNTTIISDTDSVFITSKDWVQWYCGDTVINNNAYQMTGIVIYWLTIAVKSELKKWSIKHGCAPDNLERMAMKNEFLYPTILLYEIKKVYSGIAAVMEGVVLPKPKVEIKGGSLRSSGFCKETLDFVSSTLVDHILKPSMDGPISAQALINRVVDYELKIKESLSKGETTYLGVTSVRTVDRYAAAESTAYLYWLAWEALFAEECGHIILPTKANVLQINEPTDEYFDWLKIHHPKTYTCWKRFHDRYKKYPTSIMIDPIYGKIPPAVQPLINVRHIVYWNLKPVYNSLDLLGIPAILGNKKVLYSDIY